MVMEKKERNENLDIIKGISIIIVCVGHILQANIADYSTTRIYNLIFAVQMPIFFIVSGYLSVKDNNLNFHGLCHRVLNKTIAYLVPFFSRIIIYNVITRRRAGLSPIEEIIKVYEHVDSGLWFIYVLFFISISCELSSFISSRLCKNNGFKIYLELIFYGILISPWAIMYLFFHTEVLGCKLIIYYSFFYYVGRLYRELLRNSFLDKQLVKDILFPICFIVGMWIACNNTLIQENDSMKNAFLRIISGLTLSYVLIYLVCRYQDSLIKLHLGFLGKYTLEIYYTHGIAFGLFSSSSKPILYSPNGLITVVGEFFVTGLFTLLFILAVKSNKYTDLIFYGKKEKI